MTGRRPTPKYQVSDDRGWKTIQRAIDRSDYYVVIVAGLYGSIDPETGISWTEREYEYAHAKRVPVLAFIRDSQTLLAKLTEKEPDRMRLLEAFKAKLSNHHRKTWKELGDLRVEVGMRCETRSTLTRKAIPRDRVGTGATRSLPEWQ